MVLEILGGVLALLGSLFLLLAAVGIVRMPDTYNRMQTGTKATTLGSLLFFIGIGFAHPYLWGKLGALIIFILFTNPLSSHVLARALHFSGKSPLLPGKETRDDLAADIILSKTSDKDRDRPAGLTGKAGSVHEEAHI
ncbi:MAG: monovalent cation/H(+) antiporter subunit G [Spirochaetales bacterium]|jgi:multicomponent Na+:H+ antiporter subunit G|nr:monovalent cation/H(+) antiporter subunit G [Spirochaetales bacterium]